jgi:ABC-2 type transport system permease protein
MTSALALLAIINFINLFIGAKFVDMQLNASNLAAGSLGCFLIGMLFASFGALFGAVSGKRGASLGVGAGIAILFYVFYTITSIVTKFDFIKPINPFQWLIDANQLMVGFNWSTNLKFLSLSAIAVISASWIINRRDIHSS